jgi:outer membrane protein
MKKIATLIPFLFVTILFAQVGAAQPKLGHINSQELLAAMPESDSAQKKIEKVAKEHELTLEEMQVEFNKKFDEYRTNVDTYSELKRATKEVELEDLQNRIQSFQQTAEQDIAKQRRKLFQPIQEKALNAVNEVAEEQGFTYIFDSGVGVIVYASDDSENIMPLVKEKMGLK